MLRQCFMAAIGFVALSFHATAFATCASDTWICEDDVLADPMPDPLPVYSHADVCEPRPDDCPLQSLPSDDHQSAEWVTGTGQWHGSVTWSTTQVSDDLPVNIKMQPNMIGIGWTGSGYEVSCGLTHADETEYPFGSIVCWGNLNESNQINGRPTGGEPYSSLSVGNISNGGSAGSIVGLDYLGRIVVWGRKGTNNSFDTSKPTASGFDVVAAGLGPVGCAADSDGTAGLSCWGNNSNSIVSGAPTTGSYVAIGIGASTAMAVKADGSVTLWGSSAGSSLRNNWSLPSGAGVKSVTINENGTQYGVAWLKDTDPNDSVDHEDRALIWKASGGSVEVNQNAPCSGTGCPSTGATSFEPAVKFRTAPGATETSDPGSICGVVKTDPDGVWAKGDVICWGFINQSAGVPERKAGCSNPTW